MMPLAAIAVLGVVALGQLDGGVRRGRLDESKHNLFGARSPSAQTDLCQLCHVPNRLRTAALGPPLWSPQLVGRNTALDVVADPSGPPLSLRWAGSTLRCLSCHDATISSINIVYRPSSASLARDGVAADVARAGGRHGPSLLWPDAWLARVMGNHPVSVPYPLGGEATEFRRFTARATPLDPAQWVDDPRAQGIKLLADTSGFDELTGTAGVECVSCHDPHGTPNTYFLRLPRERSELCLACHRK